MSRGRGTNDEFDGLHGLVIQQLTAALQRQGPPCKECGCGGEPPPALLAQAIKFLSENQINRPAFTGKKTKLSDKPPPGWDEDDNVLSFKQPP